MKVIEGFHVNKIQRGTKKGQDYINYSKRYVWKIPERLEGEIDKGDIVWVHSKKDDRDIKVRVLVADVLENNDGALRSIIKIAKKSKNLK
ncbi:hypothetical protein FDF26_17245 [Clostridium botulinum]|uniref:DUF5839 family protein n=1 Tax=Clostridium TaxID=1485 RepID=UPI0005046EAD|nr:MULTISPECIES: DUF5839 family protein [Clostridium]KFX54740.1 hypothetical protein KU40_13335 [Clostridium botulinum]MBN1072729.1 hypothetical protein [Clostridium botulinum]MBY6780798.1 hypothetical protein [Clostridium botulinum]MBY6853971.1 hypothetical protein [Clostridium botulinum]MBY6932359.1 hypothetical protein [Clostridium botulinum]